MPAAQRLDLRAARAAALRAQGLDGPLPRRRAGRDDVLAVARRLGCLQLDPTSVVARSQLLVLLARLGPFDPGLVDELAYGERALFEYWAHEASLVCTADLPVHAWWMAVWPEPAPSPWRRRWAAWLEAHDDLRREVLSTLAERGPLPVRELGGGRRTTWTEERGDERDHGRMVDLLWLRGEVLVRRRAGGQRLWDLAERCLPPDAPRERLDAREATRRAALRAVAALGVARAGHVRAHFTRGRYVDLEAVLRELGAEGALVPVRVEGTRGDWWARAEGADALGQDGAGPRSVLLSPFDNLICDRERTEQLFGFRHRLEIYLPRARRRWGFFVLPFLHEGALVARADLAVDRARDRLVAHAVHAEPEAERRVGPARALRRELERLAAWRGVGEVEVEGAPDRWRSVLRGDG
ncbi:MAG: winged helix DNA-binding domain-containing protein [Actinomycetota bacterium]|nr:winged helix DNA-binding domain-containing protein [Actinomycetota bacterium]